MTTTTTTITPGPARAESVPETGPRTPLLSRTWIRVAVPVLVLVAGIGLWELASIAGWINPITVPSATDTFGAMVQLTTESYFWEATWVTLQETLYGFAIGASLGLAIGALTGTFAIFRVAIWPFVVAFQNTPRIALAPIFLTWFGFGMTSKVVMAAVICFFPVVINTVAGLA